MSCLTHLSIVSPSFLLFVPAQQCQIPTNMAVHIRPTCAKKHSHSQGVLHLHRPHQMRFCRRASLEVVQAEGTPHSIDPSSCLVYHTLLPYFVATDAYQLTPDFVHQGSSSPPTLPNHHRK
jgi:hypothetical protein